MNTENIELNLKTKVKPSQCIFKCVLKTNVNIAFLLALIPCLHQLCVSILSSSNMRMDIYVYHIMWANCF